MSWSPLPNQGGIKIWVYSQDVASDTWNIYHAMGVYPLVEINAYDDQGVIQKAFPKEVIQVDLNNVQVIWTSPRRGFATIAAIPA